MLPWLINVLIGIKVGFCSCAPEIRRLSVADASSAHRNAGPRNAGPRRTGRLRSLYRVDRLGTLPRVVNESSGLARRTATTVWTHNDGGGRSTLYGVSLMNPSKLVDSLALPQLSNVDWEDLAQQDTSRLFIADLGNNANARRDLAIYIVDSAHKKAPETIHLRYADQLGFPPKNKNFDCEAVFYRSDSLFLLSKNRSGHIVRLYGLPARAGEYTLTPIDSVFIKSMVTGAALSPDGQTLAMLTYGKVLFFDLPTGNATRLTQFAGCLRLPRGQTEAITFLSATDLLITNERGRMYRIVRR